tara:strand:+ start:1654 stop:3657 length:2004 start_codon:yes stop_codon:yes gene_type:complete
LLNRNILIIASIFSFYCDFFSQDDKELETFVVTAQYKKTKQENSIHKIKVIDREKINSLGAVNLKDVLSNEINLRISQDNILGSSMSIQGVSGQNIKILIDGIPVIGRLGGNIDLSQINLNNVERIEIIEGPLAVNYGTDALAGTVNIITKKTFDNKINLKLNNYVESVGQYNTDAFLTCKIKNSNIGISLGKYFFDGWNPTDPIYEVPKPRLADINRIKQWNPKDQLFSKLEYNLVLDSQKIRTYFNIYKEKITNRGTPRIPYFESAFDDYYTTERRDLGMEYQKELKKSSLRILGAFNHFKRIKNTFFNDLTTLSEQLTGNDSDQDTSIFTQLNSRGNWTKNMNQINFQIGYDFNQQSSIGKRIEKNINSLTDIAVFTSSELNFKGLVVRPALRITYNNKYNAPIIPSLNIKHVLKNTTFRASYGKGFRAPSLKELYFNFVDINHNIVGNTSLIAEKSDNYIADVQWIKNNELVKIKIDGGLFYNDIKNMITLAISETNNQQYTYVNIGVFKTIGAQFNTSLNFKSLKFKIGYAHVGRYNNLNMDNNIPLFNYSPEFQSNLIYKIEKHQFKLAVFYKYSGKLNGYYIDNNNDISQSIINDYHNFDFNINKNFKNEKILWTIGAKNIFNVQSVTSNISGGVHSNSSSSIPINWGRSLFTSLKFVIN